MLLSPPWVSLEERPVPRPLSSQSLTPPAAESAAVWGEYTAMPCSRACGSAVQDVSHLLTTGQTKKNCAQVQIRTAPGGIQNYGPKKVRAPLKIGQLRRKYTTRLCLGRIRTGAQLPGVRTYIPHYRAAARLLGRLWRFTE